MELNLNTYIMLVNQSQFGLTYSASVKSEQRSKSNLFQCLLQSKHYVVSGTHTLLHSCCVTSIINSSENRIF